MKHNINGENIISLCICAFFVIVTFIANYIMPQNIHRYLGAVISILCVICFICFLLVLFRFFNCNCILKILIIIIATYVLFQFLNKRISFDLENIIFLVLSTIIISFMFNVSKPIVNTILLIFLIIPYLFVDLVIKNFSVTINMELLFVLYMCFVRFVYPKLCICVNKEIFSTIYDKDGLREFYKLAYLLFSILFMRVYQTGMDVFSRATVLLLIVYLIFDIKWEIFINKNEGK